jgi:hypothetical protein
MDNEEEPDLSPEDAEVLDSMWRERAKRKTMERRAKEVAQAVHEGRMSPDDARKELDK